MFSSLWKLKVVNANGYGKRNLLDCIVDLFYFSVVELNPFERACY